MHVNPYVQILDKRLRTDGVFVAPTEYRVRTDWVRVRDILWLVVNCLTQKLKRKRCGCRSEHVYKLKNLTIFIVNKNSYFT